jgi:hypothetical protein
LVLPRGPPVAFDLFPPAGLIATIVMSILMIAGYAFGPRPLGELRPLALLAPLIDHPAHAHARSA